MISIKQSADVRGLRQEVWEAIYKADQIYAEYGKNVVITSGLDSKHSIGSFHYVGLAVDLRTRHLSRAEARQIYNLLKESLGNEYDVILESTHLHVEWDPRGKRHAAA
jgi:hypothetical protein